MYLLWFSIKKIVLWLVFLLTLPIVILLLHVNDSKHEYKEILSNLCYLTKHIVTDMFSIEFFKRGYKGKVHINE